MDFRIVSIGTLSMHELWEKQGGPRSAHATTTLIRADNRVILVDPGLPPQVIAARLAERAGLEPADVTDIFLTCFRPAHRRGLAAFDHANWLIFEREREVLGSHLIEQFRNAPDDETRNLLQEEIATLKRFSAAADKLAERVDLFPLPGYTPGTCGLLLAHPQSTTLVAGDAVATLEHLERGKVLRGAYDVKQAQESIIEAVEIADVLVPGHDNVVFNPLRHRA